MKRHLPRQLIRVVAHPACKTHRLRVGGGPNAALPERVTSQMTPFMNWRRLERLSIPSCPSRPSGSIALWSYVWGVCPSHRARHDPLRALLCGAMYGEQTIDCNPDQRHPGQLARGVKRHGTQCRAAHGKHSSGRDALRVTGGSHGEVIGNNHGEMQSRGGDREQPWGVDREQPWGSTQALTRARGATAWPPQLRASRDRSRAWAPKRTPAPPPPSPVCRTSPPGRGPEATA